MGGLVVKSCAATAEWNEFGSWSGKFHVQCGTGKEKGTMHPNVESGIFKINNQDADTN